mmetsp:Transcript_21903/g.26828  ORF Transcript_21903/g.26828 Transcript_21903/m.26828 type:complete len:222 (+) Transcript_21903:897-1562(+)
MGCLPSKYKSEHLISPPTQKHNIQQNSGSAIYNALPSKYEKHHVIKVYDGDTLTLQDKRRVRFLGIDCPELEEGQPFAKEAKEYATAKCLGKDVYFSFEPGADKTDKYGRLLAWIWIGQGAGYINVNEALVSQGLASVYAPGGKKLQNWDKLVELQKMARHNKRGKWKTFKDFKAFRTKNGKAFHKRDCKHLSKSKYPQTITASKATDQGLHPCRTCLPDL